MIPQIEPLVGIGEGKAINKYLKSGGWLTEYKETEDFENRIADFLGVKYVSLVPSGTVGLFLALKALDIKGEVIVPDFTMIATINAVVWAGATPVLYDVDRSNFCLSNIPNDKPVLLVSINGRCPKMENFTNRKGILIEDACQSFGSKYKGKYLGTFGKVGVFSFSPHKIITTGQGGAIITNDKEIYEKVERLKDFGRLKGGKDYHESFGYNFKFTDIQAVIGKVQMDDIDWRIERKKEIYELYRDCLNDIVEFPETDLEQTTPWFVDILVDNRDKLAEFLKTKGIETRPFYPAIHTQPIYLRKGEGRNSEDIARRGLWLPSSLTLTDKDIKYVSSNIRLF